MITFNIQVKCDFDDPDAKLPMVEEFLRTKCMEIFSTMVLIADRREPQVALTGSDYFLSPQQIKIMAEEDRECTNPSN